MSAEGMWKGMGARLVVTVPVGGSRRCGTGIWSGFRVQDNSPKQGIPIHSGSSGAVEKGS